MDLLLIPLLIVLITVISVVGNRRERRRQVDSSPQYHFAVLARELEEDKEHAKQELMAFGMLKRDAASSSTTNEAEPSNDPRHLIAQAVHPLNEDVAIEQPGDPAEFLDEIRHSLFITGTDLLVLIALDKGVIINDAKDVVNNEEHHLEDFTLKYNELRRHISELTWHVTKLSTTVEKLALSHNVEALLEVLNTPVLNEEPAGIHPDSRRVIHKYANE